MASHTSEQRAFIVVRLAAFYEPADIAAEFIQKWSDTKCELADVHACDLARPDTLLAPEHMELWRDTRERILTDIALAAPTILRDVRVLGLHRLYLDALSRGAKGEAAARLEQIAKEVSGFYEPKGAKGKAPDEAEAPIAQITRTIVEPAAAVP